MTVLTLNRSKSSGRISALSRTSPSAAFALWSGGFRERCRVGGVSQSEELSGLHLEVQGFRVQGVTPPFKQEQELGEKQRALPHIPKVFDGQTMVKVVSSFDQAGASPVGEEVAGLRAEVQTSTPIPQTPQPKMMVK